MPPTFSIVIANYNYAHLVAEAIESALNQKYPSDAFEVVVVDDGSTDPSRSVIERHIGAHRLKTVFQENRGHAAALEAGVQAAEGRFICFLDADDLCLPNKLAVIAGRIEAVGGNPDTFFLCHDLSIMDMREPQRPQVLQRTWLRTMGAHRYGETTDPDSIDRLFPFANPSGQVFGRALISEILAALPAWAFARGPDTAMCLAAALKTWRIEYLHECLGVYRVHGANEVGHIVKGEYIAAFRWRARRPRLLGFLERWVDGLDLSPPERAKRASLLRRLERISRTVSPARGLEVPKVSVAVLGDQPPRIAASVESVQAQWHSRIELLVPAGYDPAPTSSATMSVATYSAPAGSNEFDLMASAYARSSGDYLVFLREGDRLDPEFVEHHLLWRHHGALVGLSCSDVRLASPSGTLVHADVFANSGAWTKPLQQIPPLATQLKDWVISSLSACVFRRTAILSRLFERAATLPVALRDAGAWLPVQLLHHTAGLIRIREALSTIVLEDGAAATYGYLSWPAGVNGRLLNLPTHDAKAWMGSFYAEERALFDAWLPPPWHVRFLEWLRAETSASR